MRYKEYTPNANMLLKKDGRIYTLDGFPVNMAQATKRYKSYSPFADKRINTDGSISELLSGVVSDAIAIKIDDDNTDIVLKKGYYKVLDNDENLYIVFVDNDLNIEDNEVIKDVSGYVRLQGVKFPCYLAIKAFTTEIGNTDNASMELESDFPSSIAIKKVVR